MSKPDAVNEFRIIAVKRSGHHALVLWLAAHFPGPVRHFNDARSGPGGRGDQDPTVNRLLGASDDRRPETTDGAGCTLFSYEDLDLGAGGGLAAGRGHTLLCLRDPYNMLASRYALWPDAVREAHVGILDLWCGHARKFLEGAAGGVRPVNFNAWFSGIEYRRRLAGDLGLDFTDRGRLVIPAAMIGGSSFDRSEPPPLRPRDMDVLGRWRHFCFDRDFRSFFASRRDVAELARAVFGTLEPADLWPA